MRDNCTDLRRLFLDDVPMMDVRAPVEFSHGAFPGVVNRPLMNDHERQRVGTCYKQHGQNAAIELGHTLVSGTVKAERLAAWTEFARQHPDGYLYCFRGGLRSQITQRWLREEAGIEYPRVIGGYKAMRTLLIDETERAIAECNFVLLGGLTGTGKTEVLGHLAQAVDLEAHALHRGSSFGKRAVRQPGQIDFENHLAIDLMKRRAAGCERFVLEDEARLIGSCALPLSLHRKMQEWPVVWLEEAFEARVERILTDYVINLCAEFVALHGMEEGMAAFAERMRDSLASIVKRLGGERYQRLSSILEAALAIQLNGGGVSLHRDWIATLLREYYDPMYAHQRQAKAGRVVFSGNREQVLAFLQSM